MDLKKTHDEWFARKASQEQAIWNPCARAFGLGPEGKTCSTCKYISLKPRSSVFWKCSKRKDSQAALATHRLGWPACQKYEEKLEGPNA